MKNPPVFKGVATALVTPFYKGGIDWTSFGKLIEFQLTNGVDALVVCGTTGECAALDVTEHAQAVDFCVRAARGRVPVIAGAGSNDVKKAVRLAEDAALCGASAVLAVTPYYNKATEDGLFAMYKAIAESCALPVIIYNVPSRTGMNITPEQYARLAEIDGVRGVKEADRDVAKTVRTMALCRDKLDIYCGNDELFLPFLSLGAAGLVSVASNAEPALMKKLYTAFAAGDIRRAQKAQDSLAPLEDALTCEVNPVPVKTLLASRKMCREEFRLPLGKMREENKKRLLETAKRFAQL